MCGSMKIPPAPGNQTRDLMIAGATTDSALKKGLNASEKSINSGQHARTAQVDLSWYFFLLVNFSACQINCVSHVSVGCWIICDLSTQNYVITCDIMTSLRCFSTLFFIAGLKQNRVRIHQPFFRTFFVLFSRFFHISKHLIAKQPLIC